MTRTLLVDKRLSGRYIRRECRPSDKYIRSNVLASTLTIEVDNNIN